MGERETGWLIEDANEPQWMTLKPAEAMWGLVFTKDSNEALRFARRQDAEDYYACHLDDAPVRITEHSWGGVDADYLASRAERAAYIARQSPDRKPSKRPA